MPFVQTGKAHGDAWAAEEHGAFHFCLSAHMKAAGGRELLAETADHRRTDTGTDQDLWSVQVFLELQKTADDVHPGTAAGSASAGEYSIEAQTRGRLVSLLQIPGDINGQLVCESCWL